MLGLLYFLFTGLSIKFSWAISKNVNFEYKLDGVMLMKMLILCFMVGNSACGVLSQQKEKACK